MGAAVKYQLPPRFNVGAALTCIAIALGIYFWWDILTYVADHL